jgi:hypothetical protein
VLRGHEGPEGTSSRRPFLESWNDIFLVLFLVDVMFFILLMRLFLCFLLFVLESENELRVKAKRKKKTYFDFLRTKSPGNNLRMRTARCSAVPPKDLRLGVTGGASWACCGCGCNGAPNVPVMGNEDDDPMTRGSGPK